MEISTVQQLTTLKVLCSLLFISQCCCILLAEAAIGACNFSLFQHGCYTQANFVCDQETRECKCHRDSPILINDRICVSRVKANGNCQYNEQCDNQNGLFCSFSDYEIINFSNSNWIHYKEPNEAQPKCRLIKERPKVTQNGKLTANDGQYSRRSKRSSLLPNLLWMFLLLCLLLLILLLLFIRFQHYKIAQPEDRISINNDIDTPPPYEIAIRMKL